MSAGFGGGGFGGGGAGRPAPPPAPAPAPVSTPSAPQGGPAWFSPIITPPVQPVVQTPVQEVQQAPRVDNTSALEAARAAQQAAESARQLQMQNIAAYGNRNPYDGSLRTLSRLYDPKSTPEQKEEAQQELARKLNSSKSFESVAISAEQARELAKKEMNNDRSKYPDTPVSKTDLLPKNEFLKNPVERTSYSQAISPKFVDMKPTRELLDAYSSFITKQNKDMTIMENPFYGPTPTSKLSVGQLQYSVDAIAGVDAKSAGLPLDIKKTVLATEINLKVQQDIQKNIDLGKIEYTTKEDIAKVDKIAQESFKKQYSEALKNNNFGFTGTVAYNPREFYSNLAKAGAETLLPVSIAAGASFLGAPAVALAVGDLTASYFIGKGVATGELKDIASGFAIGAGNVAFEGYQLTKAALAETRFNVAAPQFVKTPSGDMFAEIFAERTIPSGEASQTVNYKLLLTRKQLPDVFAKNEEGFDTLIKKGSEEFFGQTVGGVGKVKTTIVNEPFFTVKNTKSLGAGFKASPLEPKYAGVGVRDVKIDFPDASLGTLYTKLEKGPQKFNNFYTVSKELPDSTAVVGGRVKGFIEDVGNIKIRGPVEYKGRLFETFEDLPADIKGYSSFKGRGTGGSSINSIYDSPKAEQVLSNALKTSEKANIQSSSGIISKQLGDQALNVAERNAFNTRLKTNPALFIKIDSLKKEKDVFNFRTSEAFKEVQASRNKVKTLEASKPLFDTSARFNLATAEAQLTDQVQKTSLKFQNPTSPSFGSGFGQGFGFGSDFGFPKLASPAFKKKKDKVRRASAGFNVFVRRRGRYTPIGSNLPFGAALKLGSDKALNSLARTFKVRASGRDVFSSDVGFRPDTRLFRDYQIRKGKQRPLFNTFIQRKGISNRTEANLLQGARRKRKGFGGLF